MGCMACQNDRNFYFSLVGLAGLEKSTMAEILFKSCSGEVSHGGAIWIHKLPVEQFFIHCIEILAKGGILKLKKSSGNFVYTLHLSDFGSCIRFLSIT